MSGGVRVIKQKQFDTQGIGNFFENNRHNNNISNEKVDFKFTIKTRTKVSRLASQQNQGAAFPMDYWPRMKYDNTGHSTN